MDTELEEGRAPAPEPTDTPAPAPEPAPAPVAAPVDLDARAVEDAERELAEIEAAMKAAESGEPQPAATPAPPAPASAAPQPPAAAPSPAAPAATQGDDDGMLRIPRSQIAKLRQRIRDVETAAAYEQGRAEALERALATRGSAPDGQGNDAAPPVDPVQSKITDAEARIDAIWGKADNGELTLSEARRQERAIEAEIETLREEQRQASRPAPASPAAPPVSMSDQQLIDQQTSTLIAEHPALTVATAQDIRRLQALAEEEGRLVGKPFRAGDPREAFRLRERVAQLASQYIPSWHPDAVIPAKGQGGAAPTAAKPASPAQPSPAATRREAELRTAETHPMDINSLGRPADSGAITLDQFNNMSEQERENLPEHVLTRIEREARGVL